MSEGGAGLSVDLVASWVLFCYFGAKSRAISDWGVIVSLLQEKSEREPEAGHVLRAYTLDGRGGGVALSPEAILPADRSEGGIVWLHLDGNHPDTRPWLESEIDALDPFIVDALMAEENRPRLTQIGDGVLLILRGVNLNENEEPEDMVSICVWADKSRVIFVSQDRIRASGDIQEQLREGRGPKDCGHVLTTLCSRLFERMDPILGELDELTDEIEEMVLQDADASLSESIIDVRIQAIKFRRYMAPQREAIDHLRNSNVSWLGKAHRRHLQEVFNHVTRCVEDLEAVRDRAQIVKDELAHFQAERLNKHMYLLSLLAAIFMPLSFLTGLLGINVGGIPGAESGWGFWIATAILVVVFIGQVAVFRWLKWL